MSDFTALSSSSPVINWDQIVREMKTQATLQVVVNPRLRRGSPIHDRAFAELAKLGADYVRFVPWYPYPKDAIAELYPPADEPSGSETAPARRWQDPLGFQQH